MAHEFAVTQGAKSVCCLDELATFFGVGGVVANRRYDDHKEHLPLRGAAADGLDRTIIPFFRAHPMHSSKQRDFDRFSRCVELIEQGVHTTHSSLADIAEIAQTMNRQKPRRELIRILRGHTPEIQDTGS